MNTAVHTPETLAAVYNPSEDELTIKETVDFDQFKLIDFNRKPDEKHVLELMEAIKKHNLLSDNPITIDRNFNVLDGQHRLEAARRLNVPVYYKMSFNMRPEDIAEMNSHNKAWNLEAYLESFLKRGFREYERVKLFLDQNPEISLYSALGLLNGGTAQPGSDLIKAFEVGQYKIKDLEHAKTVVSMLKEYKEVAPKVSKTKPFINSIAKLAKTDFFQHTRMLEKIKLQPASILKTSDVKSCVNMLEEIYNYRAKGSYVSFKKL